MQKKSYFYFKDNRYHVKKRTFAAYIEGDKRA